MRNIEIRQRRIEDIDMPGYHIGAFWGPRRETPRAIARRFLGLIDRLAEIGPVFENWIYNRDGEPIMLQALRGNMEQIVERHVARAEDGEPTPIDGYRIFVTNSVKRTPRSFAISIKAGAFFAVPYYVNYADIDTDRRHDLDPAVITYPIFRSALLALSETFDVTWCSAFPGELMKHWKGDPFFHFGWMNYVSPRFASLIAPPKSAIVEHRPNGALFMAATDETFVTSNPQHLAVARDIDAAIAPLNALPWPPDAEPA